MERPSLYVVATPIGNLADITLRALEVLKRVDAIAAEDTRVTVRLLRHYGVSAPLIALHEHNSGARRRKSCNCRRSKSVALVSDAAPAISDRRGRGRAGASRLSGGMVPGANAAMTALVVAGSAALISCSTVSAATAAARRRELAAPAPRICWCSTRRPPRHRERCRYGRGIRAGARSRSRELTKLFESIHTCNPALWRHGSPPTPIAPREFVLLVEGAPEAHGLRGARR